VAPETVRLDPLTATVGTVVHAPVTFEQNPLPAMDNAVGVPDAEYVVSIEVIAGAAKAPADANPNAAATDARIIPEFWRIFFCCSFAKYVWPILKFPD
jgi:hypothetical protein